MGALSILCGTTVGALALPFEAHEHHRFFCGTAPEGGPRVGPCPRCLVYETKWRSAEACDVRVSVLLILTRSAPCRVPSNQHLAMHLIQTLPMSTVAMMYALQVLPARVTARCKGNSALCGSKSCGRVLDSAPPVCGPWRRSWPTCTPQHDAWPPAAGPLRAHGTQLPVHIYLADLLAASASGWAGSCLYMHQ